MDSVLLERSEKMLVKICPYCGGRLTYVHNDDEYHNTGYYECFYCGYFSGEYGYDFEYNDDYDYQKGLEEYYETISHKEH